MYETVYKPSCLTEEEVKTISDGFYTMQTLMEDWEGLPVHLTEFQTLGFWHHNHKEPIKDVRYKDELLHVEYEVPNHWRARHPELYPRFVEYIRSKKSIFDVEEFHYYIVDVLWKYLTEAGRDMTGSNEFVAVSLYDLDYNGFETHTDSKEVLCKKDERPKDLDFDSMKPEEWLLDEGYTRTHQGLVPINCTDTNDGTVIFDQTFDYAVYLNMARDPFEDWKDSFHRKRMVKIGKGDSLERFGSKIENFTNKKMSMKDYKMIMSNCEDKNEFPIEHGFGLSVDRVCDFHSNGTLFDWDARKFHRTKPVIRKETDKRLTLVYGCGRLND